MEKDVGGDFAMEVWSIMDRGHCTYGREVTILVEGGRCFCVGVWRCVSIGAWRGSRGVWD